MAKLLDKNSYLPSIPEVNEQLLRREIHIVCSAYHSGLTPLGAFAEATCLLKNSFVSGVADAVNKDFRVRSLFPHAFISVIPGFDSETMPDHRVIGLLKEQLLLKCLKEVFAINNELIKSKKIYFFVEPYYLNEDLMKQYLETLILDKALEDSYVEEVII